MRVLHVVSTDRRRGAEIFASDLVGALSKRDVEQQVVILRDSGSRQVHYDAPITGFDADGWKAPLFRIEVGTLQGLRELTARLRPEVVQAHGGEALKYVIPAAAGTPSQIVYRRIGSGPSWTRYHPRRVAYARLMRSATQVVAVAEFIRKETIERFKVPPHRVLTIPNAVDSMRLRPLTDRVAVRSSWGIDPSAYVMISVGAFTWEKDPLAQLEVLTRVAQRRPSTILVMVGDGPLRSQVEDEIAARGLQGNVLLLGSRTDVADLLSAADVLLLTSQTEGMPAAAIEAGLCGIPVVSYALAGIPEVVQDGVTGGLASVGDLEGLVRRVIGLLDDEGERRIMGAAAREICSSEFEIHPVAGRYLELYEGLVEAAA